MSSEILGKAASLYRLSPDRKDVLIVTSAPAGLAPLHLAVALDGAGWHPAAWREAGAQPQRLFTAGYWTELAQQAERGLLDFLTIEDGLDLQSDDRFQADSRLDRVRGRLDAVLIAARAAPATRHIGFVPTAITSHTEPFHLSKAIATLDYVSSGRAGVRVQVAVRADTADHFGRRESPPLQAERLADPDVQDLIADHFDEAADYVEVLRRLWDSWRTTRKSGTWLPAASSTGTSCTTSTSKAAGSR